MMPPFKSNSQAKHTGLIFIVCVLVLSCSTLPRIHPEKTPAGLAPDRVCSGVYPVEDWQLLHTIEADFPGGRKGFLMGLTILSPQKGTIRCVMMTFEGLVVFEAVYDGGVKVERAVAPFDNDAFANGLMADIRLVFFKPPAYETTFGKLDDGTPVCRCRCDDSRIVDITRPDGTRWETRLYDSNHRRLRTVENMVRNESSPRDRPGVADTIRLTAHGSRGYVLNLELVEAVLLKPSNKSN